MPNIAHRARPVLRALCLATAVVVASALSVQATVLDSFSGAKTGWTDTLNGGTVTQTSPEFIVSSASSAGALTYSLKTSNPFSVAPGNGLEFKVNVDAVTGTGDPRAILGWVPSGGTLQANGYSVTVGAEDLVISKNGSPVYSTNFSAASITLPIGNMTILLRMTGTNSGVNVLARVYRRFANGLAGQYYTAVADYTYNDPSGLFVSGYAALGAKNTSAGGATFNYSVLQQFNTTQVLLDAFTGSSVDTTKWTIQKKDSPDTVTESSAGLQAMAIITSSSGGYAGVTSIGQYPIVAGGEIEFQLDAVENDLAPAGDSYAVLEYLPGTSPTYLTGQIGYHVATDYINTGLIYMGKGYGMWFAQYNGPTQPPVSPPGSHYTLTLYAETNFNGSVNCRVEGRVEDLSVPVNDPNRLVFQSEWVDTTNIDLAGEAAYGGAFKAPYLQTYGAQGSFGALTYNAGATPPGSPDWAIATYQNAVVRQTTPPPAPAVITAVTPAYSQNYVPSASSVSFTATDANSLPINGMSLTLNGVIYANGIGGVAITQNGGPTSLNFVLTGALAADMNYTGNIAVTNSGSLVANYPVAFDTFSTGDYVVESEEYNFSSDGGATGGAHIDNPIVVALGGTAANAYNGNFGLPGVDFNDNRGTDYGSQPGTDPVNRVFRGDWPYQTGCSDIVRPKYTAVVGSAEVVVNDIHDGDWMNYTHGNYPAGTFNVYLRQSARYIPNSLVTLERVTNPTGTPQANSVLGMFANEPSDGQFGNVPLTDGLGNPIVLRLAGGADTFQINNRTTGNSGGAGLLTQNYFIFVPVTVFGTLGPVLSLATPQVNATLASASPTVTAFIANRDTSVQDSTVMMEINGSVVAATHYPTNGGDYVTYMLPQPLPTPGSIVTSTVIYQDNSSPTPIWYTNTWSWTLTYSYFNPANSQPVLSMTKLGIDARIVVSTALDIGNTGPGNSTATARTLLAYPPPAAVDYTSTNIVSSGVNWGLTGTENGGCNAFPGLCLPTVWQSSFAVEAFAYVHLPTGLSTFITQNDDDVGIYSGKNLGDDSVTILDTSVGGNSGDIIVGAEGLYPIHIIYEEGKPGANLRVTVISGGTTNVLGAGGPEVYYPFVVQSASSPKGPWTADLNANAAMAFTFTSVNCDGTGAPIANDTLTGGSTSFAPTPGATKFYRVSGPRPTKITPSSYHVTGHPPTSVSFSFTGQ